MDFIEHVDFSTYHLNLDNIVFTFTFSQDVSAHPMVPPFDLDPFDMLGEFTELDQYGGKS